MQVPHPEQQHRVMIEAVENHMPGEPLLPLHEHA
jgi:stage III sporulation protein SpoIIIAA